MLTKSGLIAARLACRPRQVRAVARLRDDASRSASWSRLFFDSKVRRLLAGSQYIDGQRRELVLGDRFREPQLVPAPERRTPVARPVPVVVHDRVEPSPGAVDVVVGESFGQTHPDPFVLKVYEVRESEQKEIAAVTHADGTRRLQTVTRDVNRRYDDLISVPLRNKPAYRWWRILPFNGNEPIICTPEEALHCSERTHMDVLVPGTCIVTKTG